MSFKLESNAKGVSIKIQRSLKAKGKAIDNAVNQFIDKVETDAKRNLVSNKSIFTGKLLSSFRKRKTKTEKILWVENDYAPFVEFGTKKNFKLEYPQLAPVARKFRGNKVDSGFKDIKKWAASKGISKKDAFKIIKSLAREGSKAHPFFYRAVFTNKVFLQRRLKAAIRKRR